MPARVSFFSNKKSAAALLLIALLSVTPSVLPQPSGSTDYNTEDEKRDDREIAAWYEEVRDEIVEEYETSENETVRWAPAWFSPGLGILSSGFVSGSAAVIAVRHRGCKRCGNVVSPEQ